MTETPPATNATETPSPSNSNPPTAKDWVWSKAKAKLVLDLKKPWVENELDRTTLEYQALKFPPTENDLKLFAAVEEPIQRQVILARLRMLEKEVNLKTLPVVVALVTVAAAVIGLSLTATKTEQPDIYGPYLTGITTFVIIAAVIVFFALRNHTQKEACLTAWTEAFEDTHSLKTKLEEEERKARADEKTAPAAAGTPPTVTRYAWAVKIFG